MSCQFVLLVLLSVSVVHVQSGRILYSAPFGSKSHQNSYVPVIKILHERGHHVTLITNYAVKELNSLANVEQFEINELKIDNAMFGDAFKKAISSDGTALDGVASMINSLKKLDAMSTNVASIMYSNPQVLSMLDGDTFDLVIVSQFFAITGYPLAWHFNATLAMFSPGALFPGIAHVLGDSDHTEYVPNPLLELSNRMSLGQRILNTVSLYMFDQFFTQRHKSSVHSLVQTVLPDCPPLDEIEHGVSLVFTNSHPIFHYPRTMTPEMVEIGGVHCRPAQPLSPEFEEFVGEHEAGFIIFALGSALQTSDMPVDMLNAFIQLFRELPQRVIWQWKGTKNVDLPSNIMTVNWLPQQDLLGHRNCRLFLTHGGLNSVMEAVYHGVPILGLPLSTDQFANLGRSQKEGYSVTLNWRDITQHSLSTSIQELLNNPKYAKTAGTLSRLMRDQPLSPLERAVYWIEFHLRNKGTKQYHLGSRYLTSYQRAMFDVYAVIGLVFSLPIAFLVFILRHCCCSKKPKLQNVKKRQ